MDILNAAQQGFVGQIRSVLDSGVDVDYVGPEGRTALRVASLNGHVGAIDALVRHGARVDLGDSQGRTALFFASLHGKVGAIEELVRHGATVDLASLSGKTALSAASWGGHIGAVDALVAHGATVNKVDNRGKTALMYASAKGGIEIINALLTAGANVDEVDTDGQTALFQASGHGNVRIFDALLAAGADVHRVDNQAQTLLFGAAEYGSLDAINALVAKHGVDVNHYDNQGQTALFSASKVTGNARAVSALLDAGAHVDHLDNQYQTALSLALRSHFRNYETIEALLTAVARIDHLDNQGRMALDRFRAFFEISGIPHGRQATMRDFLSARSYAFKTMMLRTSVSLKDYIVNIVVNDPFSNLGIREPFNISLDTFSDDGKMGMFFRYGRNTVVSIYFSGSMPRVAHLQATAPICTGDGRVIYTKRKHSGESHVYENSIDLGNDTEIELCHSLSTGYEKNWGCFGRTGPGNYFIVYSVIPLRIFKVEQGRICSELPAVQLGFAYENPPDRIVVKKEYPNFESIERMYTDERDSRGTSIFRGGTRGIKFGDEYLFVGHVTLHQEENGCFPSWLTHRNTDSRTTRRMYFMYFFTVRLGNGMFKISRMSSCFQPPSWKPFHKIIFPCGIARRTTDIVVSFGRDDSDCVITSYSEADVKTMLVPVHSWNEKNYVFHPNYASSLRQYRLPVRSTLGNILPTGRVGLVGTSPVSPDSDDRFNPAITNFGTQGNQFVTAWRKMNGSVQSWRGYNQVAMESCSLKIKRGKLVYKRESEMVEFQVGNTVVGGEDPRLITENGCPLLFVNDFDSNSNRRMYVHNLETDDSAMITHPFCHNISGNMEKNWGPFYVNGELLFVYSVEPLVVGTVGEGFQCPRQNSRLNIECELISSTETPENLANIFEANGLKMRGGTPGLLFDDKEYLFVGHAVQGDESRCFPDFTVQRSVNASDDPDWRKRYQKFYTAFFYTISKQGHDEWKIKRISCCSHFPEKRENFTKIHFPAGLAKANLGGEFEDAFIVSFGEKDMYGGFCAVNRKFLNYVLRPVSEWDVHNYVVDVNYFKNIANIDPEF